jgi:hypothetical protein
MLGTAQPNKRDVDREDGADNAKEYSHDEHLLNLPPQ